MTVPMHTAKHIRTSFRRYQVLALFFAIITISAALLAALSGLQVNHLRHEHAIALANAPTPEPAPDPAVARLEQELETVGGALAETRQQLSSEKDNARKLTERMAGLERQLAAATAKALERSETPPPDPAVVARLENDLETAHGALAETQRLLASEQDTNRDLMDRVAELMRRLAATDAEVLQGIQIPPPEAPASEATPVIVPSPPSDPRPDETGTELEPIPGIPAVPNPDAPREH